MGWIILVGVLFSEIWLIMDFIEKKELRERLTKIEKKMEQR